MLLMTHPLDEKNEDILVQMHQLRARQFKLRRGLNVDVKNNEERDGFDGLIPLYLCLINNDRRLLASLRLLPTVGPHMLADVFPEVMGEQPVVRDVDVWESSRFCVDTDFSREFGQEGVNLVTRSILTGLFETAKKRNLKNIVSVYDVYVERILKRAGCKIERTGPVVKYDNLKTVGGLFEVSDTVIDRLKSRNDISKILAAA